MGLSKEILWLVPSLQKVSDHAQALCILAVREPRRRDLCDRLTNCASQSSRGRKMASMRLEHLNEDTMKVAETYLRTFFSANAAQALILSSSTSSNAKDQYLWQKAFDWARQFASGYELKIVYDPALTRAAFINNALKKSGLKVQVQACDERTKPLCDLSSFMAECAAHPKEIETHQKIHELLNKLASLSRQTTLENADLSYLEKTASPKTWPLYKQMIEQDPALLPLCENLLKKKADASLLKNYLALLEAGMDVPALMTLTPAKAARDFDNLLTSLTRKPFEMYGFDKRAAQNNWNALMEVFQFEEGLVLPSDLNNLNIQDLNHLEALASDGKKVRSIYLCKNKDEICLFETEQKERWQAWQRNHAGEDYTTHDDLEGYTGTWYCIPDKGANRSRVLADYLSSFRQPVHLYGSRSLMHAMKYECLSRSIPVDVSTLDVPDLNKLEVDVNNPETGWILPLSTCEKTPLKIGRASRLDYSAPFCDLPLKTRSFLSDPDLDEPIRQILLKKQPEEEQIEWMSELLREGSTASLLRMRRIVLSSCFRSAVQAFLLPVLEQGDMETFDLLAKYGRPLSHMEIMKESLERGLSVKQVRQAGRSKQSAHALKEKLDQLEPDLKGAWQLHVPVSGDLLKALTKVEALAAYNPAVSEEEQWQSAMNKARAIQNVLERLQ